MNVAETERLILGEFTPEDVEDKDFGKVARNVLGVTDFPVKKFYRNLTRGRRLSIL